MTLAEYIDTNDYEKVEMALSKVTESLHEILKALTNEPLNQRKKREVNQEHVWSNFADQIELIVRFVMETRAVGQW